MAKLSNRSQQITKAINPLSPASAGTLLQYAGTSAPSGWAECSGQAISRTDFSTLFSNVGTKYGIGDGSTTFNLPDGPRRTVEVDLAFSSTPTGWSLNEAIGVAYQTALGEWRLSFNITATATASTNLVAALYGVFSTTTWSISNAESSAIGSRAFFGSSNVTVNTASSQGNFIVSGDVSLDSKPTDDFVLADSRFSTFDEALESTPIIKLYDDSVDGATVGIGEATATTAGTAKTSDAADATQQYLVPIVMKHTIENAIFTLGGQTATTDIKFTRIGDQVVMMIAPGGTLVVSGNSSDNTFDTTEVVPVDFRPNETSQIQLIGGNPLNNSIAGSSPGMVEIGTAGQISLRRDPQNTSWGTSGNNGFNRGFSVCWNILD